MKLINKLRRITIFRFFSVGAIATLLHSAVYSLFILNEISPQTANFIGYGSAFLFSFFGQTYFTFNTKTSVDKSYKFILVSILGYFVNSFWVWLVQLLNFDTLFAVIPIALVTPILTYFLLKYWVYKRREAF